MADYIFECSQNISPNGSGKNIYISGQHRRSMMDTQHFYKYLLYVYSVSSTTTPYIQAQKGLFIAGLVFPLITLATYSSLCYLDLYFIVLEIGIRNQQGSSDCYGCSFTISVLHMSHISYFKILATFSSYCNKPHFALVLTTSAFHNPGNWCQKPKLH